MATYTYNTSFTFNADGSYASFETGGAPKVLVEPDADDTFEEGDVSSSAAAVNYLGVFELPLAAGGTETVPVFSSPSLVAGRFTLFASQGISDYNFNPFGGLTASQVASIQSSDTFTVCFAPGTRINTPTGTCDVERLSIGDLVVTQAGPAVPVKWIGRQTVFTAFGPAERLLPVRVWAGALGDGLPERDLVLTADHALLIDGLLINAVALVNGSSIDYVPLSELGESYTVYHIETEDHDIILAEGTPAETFIDYVGRQAFDNYAEYVALYGEDRTIRELTYPRVSSVRLLPKALCDRMARADRPDAGLRSAVAAAKSLRV